MNNDEFKHFKLHSDSTLKKLTKDELISYIHMLYHNWGATDEAYYNVMMYANTLDRALDKACGKLEYDNEKDGGCPSVHYGFTPLCCNQDFCDGSNLECWKDWCLKNE